MHPIIQAEPNSFKYYQMSLAARSQKSAVRETKNDVPTPLQEREIVVLPESDIGVSVSAPQAIHNSLPLSSMVLEPSPPRQSLDPAQLCEYADTIRRCMQSSDPSLETVIHQTGREIGRRLFDPHQSDIDRWAKWIFELAIEHADMFLQEFAVHVPESKKEFFLTFALASGKIDSVNILADAWSIDHDTLLRLAVAEGAMECVESILSRKSPFTEEVMQQCLHTAVARGYVEIAIILSKGDLSSVANIVFQDEIKCEIDKKALTDKIYIMYRLNSVHVVDEIMNAFIKLIDLRNVENVKTIWHSSRTHCLKWLPFVSQYARQHHLNIVNIMYQQNARSDFLKLDENYACQCLVAVEQFVVQLRDCRIIRPSTLEYNQLPSSSTGTRRFAALLEAMASKRNTMRPGDEVQLRMGFRSCSTFKMARYYWSVRNLNKFDKNCHFYISNQNIENIHLLAMSQKHIWLHGLAPVSYAWEDIENIFENIISMELKTLEDVNVFYNQLIRLIWLIGNTTPLNRGSGTVVEWTWALAHMYHGLSVPLLKKTNPQLDPIGLTLLLREYQEHFREFFEPETIGVRADQQPVRGQQELGDRKEP